MNNTRTQTPSATPKKGGVASIIAGLNRKGSTPATPQLTVVNNPLRKKVSNNTETNEAPFTTHKANSSPKTSSTPLSPTKRIREEYRSSPSKYHKLQAGSPMREPRSPLQSLSPNTTSPASSPSHQSSSSSKDNNSCLTSPLRHTVHSMNKRRTMRQSSSSSSSSSSDQKNDENASSELSLNLSNVLSSADQSSYKNSPSKTSSRVSQLQSAFSPSSPSSSSSSSSPRQSNNRSSMRTPVVLNIRPSKPQNNDPPSVYQTPADPSTPTRSTFDRKTIYIQPSSSSNKLPPTPSSNDESLNSSFLNMSNQSQQNEFSILFDKIKKQSTRQFELAVYQMIELFTKNQQYRRSPIILQSFLQFNPNQLVQFLLDYLSPNRSIDDRRNVADTMSSLLSLQSPKYSKEISVITELLKSNNSISVMMECMKDEDWLLRSYVVAIFSILNIEPTQFLNMTENTASLSADSAASFSASSNPLFAIHNNIASNSSIATSSNERSIRSNSINSINDYSNSKAALEKISKLLESKITEVKEMAMSSMMCLGPIAGSLLPELTDILLRDKNANLRILACKTIEEIGLPYSLPMIDILNEVVKKDKDESVRKFAFKVYESLFLRNNQFPIPSLPLSRPEKKIMINKSFLREILLKSNSTASGNSFKGLTFADITKLVERQYPNIDKELPTWRSQLKITIKRMMEENSASKTPAIYSFSF